MLITRQQYRNRQDPEVKELIEYFKSGKFAKVHSRDEFFSRCNSSEIELIKKEISCCQEDFRYAAKNYFTITDKEGIDTPFSLWESQELILDALDELKKKNRPQKLIIIKARQLGCSLLIEAIMAWGTMFFPNKTALVVSYNKDHAAYLFSYMYNIVFRMPVWLQPEMSTYKFEQGLVFDVPSTKTRKGTGSEGLNSRISVQWANKLTGVGQGIRVNQLHASEFSDWYNAEQVIEEDMKYALVNDVSTIAILESTAKGVGNYSHQLWERMVELGDDAAWKPLFLPWFFEKKRVLAPPQGWKPNSEMVGVRDTVENEWVRCSNPLCLRFRNRYLRGHDLSDSKCDACNKGVLSAYVLKDNQLYFMEDERKNAKDVKKVKQELATTATEAFIVSGDPIFPEECVDFATSTKREPRYTGFLQHIDRGDKSKVLFHGIDARSNNPNEKCPVNGCTADHWVDKRDLQVWELPKKDCVYYVGVDPSNGLGGSKDHSVIWVNRIDKAHFFDVQVAMFRSNEIDPVDLAYVAARIGYWYNEAEIACEYTGLRTTADTLRVQVQYPNLYRSKNFNNKNFITNICAWSTNHVSKPALLVQGVRALKARSWVIRSERFVTEMKTFQKDKNTDTPNSLNNVGAAKNANDDVVMAGLICEFCAHEMDYDADLGYIPINKASMESAAWKMHCEACFAEWPAESPTDQNNCPKCGSLHISANRNMNQAATTGGSFMDQIDDYEWDDSKEKDWQMY